MLPNLNVILCRTTHPGNIGAAARAVKTMGIESMRLVDPSNYPSAEATARASGAADLLETASVHDSLAEAVADRQLVFGASARSRAGNIPQLNAREAAEKIVALSADTEVALVFGQERSGLSNDEMGHCHYLVQIDANPDYASLNLAAAVQLMCYDVRMAALAQQGRAEPEHEPLANQQHFDSFIDSWLSLMESVGFGDEKQSASLKSRIRRVFMRAEPLRSEVDLLHGMLSQLLKRLNEHRDG